MNPVLKSFLLTAALLSVLVVSASAADYSFTTDARQDYYESSSYEDIYGVQYNYGGPNVTEYQIPELAYGSPSTTQIGIMERSVLRDLQETVFTGSGNGIYGLGGSTAVPNLTYSGLISAPEATMLPIYQQPAHTSVTGMAYADGSIGTVSIPSLGIHMKVWEGETSESMKKGLGHYSSSSAWDGNVAMCGHNRGTTYVIGSIKDLQPGDQITYTTIYGTRTYAVTTVEVISSTDWGYLQSTSDNRITLTTCLADHPESRVCVQASEIR